MRVTVESLRSPRFQPFQTVRQIAQRSKYGSIHAFFEFRRRQNMMAGLLCHDNVAVGNGESECIDIESESVSFNPPTRVITLCAQRGCSGGSINPLTSQHIANSSPKRTPTHVRKTANEVG
jgi:hypothetical protein